MLRFDLIAHIKIRFRLCGSLNMPKELLANLYLRKKRKAYKKVTACKVEHVWLKTSNEGNLLRHIYLKNLNETRFLSRSRQKEKR